MTDANTIGTAYLRRRRSPSRSEVGRSALLRAYNDLAIRLTYELPGSVAIRATAAEQGEVQRALWRFAGESLDARPRDSAPRLYLDSLNEIIDQQMVRLSGLNNRVPDPVLWLELLGPHSRWAFSRSTSRFSARAFSRSSAQRSSSASSSLCLDTRFRFMRA